MHTIKLGIVGTGLIWEHVHRPVVDGMSAQYEVTALCARKWENQEKWKRQYPHARIYARYEDLLEDTGVDVVAVATPIHLNGKITLEALNAGKDVFAEKPMCLSYEEAEEILRAQRNHDKKVYMLEQFLYDPKISYISDMIANKRMGDLISFYKVSHSIADPDNDHTIGYFQTDWRKNPEYPLGLLFDGGAHAMAVLVYLHGIPQTVYANGVNMREGFGEYDFVMMSFGYDGGAAGMFSHAAYLEPSNNRDTILFTEGTVNILDHEIRLIYNDGSRDTVAFEEGHLHESMWAQLYADYMAGEDGICTAKEAAEVIRVFDAVAESIAAGKSVRLQP